MRIVHVTDCYLPRLGGIERQVHDLAAEQVARGDDVTVLTSTPAGLAPPDPGHPAPATAPATASAPAPAPATHPEPGGPRVVRVGPGEVRWRADAVLARALADGPRVDAVHAHTSLWSPTAWALVGAAVRAGLPVVLTQHSVLPDRSAVLAAAGALGPWRSWPVRWTAVSGVAAEPLARLLDGPPVHVLPNAVDGDWWARPGAASTGSTGSHQAGGAGAGPAGLVLVSALRFAPRKRPSALLDVLERVREQVPAEVPLRAVLAGEGPLLARARRRVRRSGLADWVELPGRLDREQLRALFHTADAYLATARQESFGLAALEARCAGLAVLAMAGTGTAEFVTDGWDGVLAHDDDHLARAAARLADPAALAVVRARTRGGRPATGWDGAVRGVAEHYRAAAPVTAPVRAAAPLRGAPAQ